MAVIRFVLVNIDVTLREQAGSSVFPEVAHVAISGKDESVFLKRNTSGLSASSSEGNTSVMLSLLLR
jgi:hypothetical protein